MEINLREAKSILVKSNIPSIDYVINPYIGCQHGCIYCYAEFMIRFTNHKGEQWGEFLDVKTFNFEKVKPQKYDGKTILLSSVTDPYLPLEKKYMNTRKILEKLIGTRAKISILTKSKLIVRDIDLFTQFHNLEVGISLCTLDTGFAKIVEPHASNPADRLDALQKISQAGIKTYTFISPYFPEITDYKAIIDVTRNYSDQYIFENLNFRPHNISRIMGVIQDKYPEILKKYQEIRKNHEYWDVLETDIKKYCEKEKLEYKIEFHHGGFSKS
ncbi:MAG: radical SAM protein [Candidatus Hodarchaeales archaeon]|jgi:DNA repair photolyase